MKADKTKSVTKTTTNRREYRVYSDPLMMDPYYDECWYYHKQNEWRNHWKRKRILSYQVRMYRTWKHNRKTQWKE